MTIRLLPQGCPVGPGLASPRSSPWAFAYMVSSILHDPVSSTVMSAHLGDTVLLEFFHHDGGPPGLVQARLKGLGDTAWGQWFSCLVSPVGQLLQDLHRLLHRAGGTAGWDPLWDSTPLGPRSTPIWLLYTGLPISLGPNSTPIGQEFTCSSLRPAGLSQ